MNYIHTLSLITTSAEAATCILCARALWSLGREGWDRPRRLLAQGSGLIGLFAALMIAASIFLFGDAQESKTALLSPWMIFGFMVVNAIMVLYPITVVNPKWFTRRSAFYYFLPIAVFLLVFLGFSVAGAWTPISSPEAVWDNLGRIDVLVRLAILIAMIPYCLCILFLPYNYRHSSASTTWIKRYCLSLTLLYSAHVIFTLTNWAVLIVIIPVLASLFFLHSTEYELEHRILPDDEDSSEEEPEDAEAKAEPSLGELGLWERICVIMDTEQAWRDPNLSLSSLAQKCATNTTYLNREIKDNTGGSFKELLNAKRVDYIVKELRRDPYTDLQTVFFNAGFRSRATAWRNFKTLMGVSPAEFCQSLKN